MKVHLCVLVLISINKLYLNQIKAYGPYSTQCCSEQEIIFHFVVTESMGPLNEEDRIESCLKFRALLEFCLDLGDNALKEHLSFSGIRQ